MSWEQRLELGKHDKKSACPLYKGPVWFGVGDAFEQKKQNNPAERVASNALLPAATAAKRGTLNYARQNRRSVLWLAYGL